MPRKAEYEARKAKGWCSYCKNPPTPPHVLCDECLEKVKLRKPDPELVRKNNQRARAKRMDTLVRGYGGRCTCCGKTDRSFLTLDHVNGDGKEHRDRIGVGEYVYIDAIRRGFPPNLQLLCADCHLAKDKKGGCPHKEEPTYLKELQAILVKDSRMRKAKVISCV